MNVCKSNNICEGVFIYTLDLSRGRYSRSASVYVYNIIVYTNKSLP